MNKFTDDEIDILEQMLKVFSIRLNALVDTGVASVDSISEYEDLCDKLMYFVTGGELQ